MEEISVPVSSELFWPFTIEFNFMTEEHEVLDTKDQVWFSSKDRTICDKEAIRYSAIYILGLKKQLGSNKPKIFS